MQQNASSMVKAIAFLFFFGVGCSKKEAEIKERSHRASAFGQIKENRLEKNIIAEGVNDSSDLGFALLSIDDSKKVIGNLQMQSVEISVEFKQDVLPAVRIDAKADGEYDFFEYALCSAANPEICLPSVDKPGVMVEGGGESYLFPVGETLARVRACSGVRSVATSLECSKWQESSNQVSLPAVQSLPGYLQQADALQDSVYKRFAACEHAYLRTFSLVQNYTDSLDDSNFLVMLKNALRSPYSHCVASFETGYDQELLLGVEENLKKQGKMDARALELMPGFALLALNSGVVFDPRGMIAIQNESLDGLALTKGIRIFGAIFDSSDELADVGSSAVRISKNDFPTSGVRTFKSFELPDNLSTAARSVDDLKALNRNLDDAGGALEAQNVAIKGQLDSLAQKKFDLEVQGKSPAELQNLSRRDYLKEVDDLDELLARGKREIAETGEKINELRNQIKSKRRSIKEANDNANIDPRQKQQRISKLQEEIRELQTQKAQLVDEINQKKVVQGGHFKKRAELEDDPEVGKLLKAYSQNKKMKADVDLSKSKITAKLDEVQANKNLADQNIAGSTVDDGIKNAKTKKGRSQSDGKSQAGSNASASPQKRSESPPVDTLGAVLLVSLAVVGFLTLLPYILNAGFEEDPIDIGDSIAESSGLALTAGAEKTNPIESYLQKLGRDFLQAQEASSRIIDLQGELAIIILDALEDIESQGLIDGVAQTP